MSLRLLQELADIVTGIHCKCVNSGISLQAECLDSRLGHTGVNFDHINTTSGPDLLNISRKNIPASSNHQDRKSLLSFAQHLCCSCVNLCIRVSQVEYVVHYHFAVHKLVLHKCTFINAT